MPRKLKPCGTTAAYSRHLYKGEEPCDACKDANTASKATAPSGANYWGSHWDKVIAAEPPEIVWRFDRVRRIHVAVSVNDPHAETTSELRRQRQLATYSRRAEEQHEREQAVERARRPVCTDENLLNAARAVI